MHYFCYDTYQSTSVKSKSTDYNPELIETGCKNMKPSTDYTVLLIYYVHILILMHNINKYQKIPLHKRYRKCKVSYNLHKSKVIILEILIYTIKKCLYAEKPKVNIEHFSNCVEIQFSY